MAVSLHANRFGLSEHKHNTWCVVLETGTPYEAVFASDFWAHVASSLRSGDIIQVRNDESTIFAELYVRGADRLYATVSEIRKVVFSDIAQAGEPLVYSKWGGPHYKHSVYRKSDNERLKTGFDTPEQAAMAAVEMSKVLAS